MAFARSIFRWRAGPDADTALPELQFAVDAIAAVAQAQGLHGGADALRHRFATPTGSLTFPRILRAINDVGLRSKHSRRADYDSLVKARKPLMIVDMEGACLILAAATMEGVKLIHPRTGLVQRMPKNDFMRLWNGTAISMAPKFGSAVRKAETAGKAWFLRIVLRYRMSIAAIMTTSLILQLTGLATPLLFQIIIDKVLVHRSTSTLTVVSVSLVAIALLEATVTWLRSYSVAHASAKIDVHLGAGLFGHLLSLPLQYFDHRPAGQTVARVRELENIRSFLTSQGATSIIDAIFSLIYLGVLAIYSLQLTAIVLIALPAFFILATLVRVPLRTLVRDKFNRGAEMQQHLIESILGAHTIKAMAIEPSTQLVWEERLVSYVLSATNVATTGALGGAGIQLISKLCSAAILFFGAGMVMDGTLSVGSLVAFNMIAGQLMAPAVRLSSAWQDLQQVQMSIGRVGDILDSEPEFQPAGRMELGTIKGKIDLTGVIFRYAPGGPEILKGVSVRIPAGQIVGIIGPSGSGKSTLARILQRLHSAEIGKVLIDGHDIAQVPTDWFRRQIGVVLQETYLLNRSIHDNIALSNPSLSREGVVELAKLAGAHNFIAETSLGYDTLISERGANLSGGQRQRIAIARALASNPKILILDEATSALDYESEQAIQKNMRAICQGRTVIIIAHRMAAVRDCDRIIALQAGRIVEDGSPVDLASNVGGLYHQMLQIQSGTVNATT
ncbi:type I secretion system permease/ATPase [Sphingobium sp. Sx8-8]|uniref:peptidase domain-containing ABC transporter n=1 Tax=Sphingobium sp. Sx8-8 TaxID=2933617 RepID=UPI001F57E428|nr:type I secretion system permease/ATPase [Sphingobium sp. Sx8-8]